ncbi:MAG: hypothetical protein ACT4PY_15530 [Armatimonadota bacterium]
MRPTLAVRHRGLQSAGMRIGLGLAAIVALAAIPALADEALLRRAFGTFMRSADELRIEAIPDLYEGGYARITAVGKRVVLIDGMRVDEAMVNLVGVSLDPVALHSGTLKVLDFRDSAFHARVLLRSIQEYFNANRLIDDMRLWVEDGYLLGTGTVNFRGQATRMRMKGFFAVSGTTEVWFYFETLHANNLPMPVSIIRDLERQINPIVRQETWPVTFKIRSLRLDGQSLSLSSRSDGTCPTCGGGNQPIYNP